jgi:phosphatidylethanolamine/phosphatidyl-N-methylethanolamine N-methyltransferase
MDRNGCVLHNGYMDDRLTFLKRLIADPLHIGAVAPSGRALARAMAAQIDPARSGPIVELGPGTGVVTAAIHDRGFDPERIVAIERDAALTALLSRRFPRIRVIEGDALDLDGALAPEARGRVAAIVSSLPLLNFAPAQRSSLLRQAFGWLSASAPFVQFSYGLRPPVEPPDGMGVERAAVVYRNLPPARVWVYRALG